MISIHIQNKEKNKQRNSSKNKGYQAVSLQDRIIDDVSDEHLYLNYLSIFKIDRIPSNYEYISELYLSHNMLRSLKGIEQFKSLRILHLKFNFIAEFEEIDRVSNKFYLKSLNLQGNPIMKIEKNLLTFNYLKANIFENLSSFNSDEPDPPNQMSQYQNFIGNSERQKQVQQSRNLDERENLAFKSHRFIKDKVELKRGSSSSNFQSYNEKILTSKQFSSKNHHMRHQSSSSVLQENKQNAEQQIGNALSDVMKLLNKTNCGIKNYLQTQQLIINNKNTFTNSSKTTPIKKQRSPISQDKFSECQNKIEVSINNKKSSKFIKYNEDANGKQQKNISQQQNKILEDQESQHFDDLNQSDCNKIDLREVYENDISTIESRNQYKKNEITPCRKKSILGNQYVEISDVIQSEREKSLENIRQLKKNVQQVEQNLQNLEKNIESQKNIEQMVLNMSSVQSQLSTTHKLTSNLLKSCRNSEIINLQNSIISNGNYTTRATRQQSAHFFQQNPLQTSINSNINNTIEIDSQKKGQNRMSNHLQLVINHQKQYQNQQYKQSSSINTGSDKLFVKEDLPNSVNEHLNQTLQKSKSFLNQQQMSDSQSIVQTEQFHEALSKRNRKILAESISSKSRINQNLHKYLDAEQLITTPSSSRRSNSFIKYVDNKMLRFCENQQITPKSQKKTDSHNGIPRNTNGENQSQVLKDIINYEIESKPLKIPNSGNNTNDMIKKQQQYNIQMINEHLQGKAMLKKQYQDFSNLNNNIQSEDHFAQKDNTQYSTQQCSKEKENIQQHISYSPNIYELQQHILESPKISLSPKIFKKSDLQNQSEVFSLTHKQSQQNIDQQQFQLLFNDKSKNDVQTIHQQQLNNYHYQNNSNGNQININRINLNNYQIPQQYISSNNNDQSGSQFSRLTNSKSQYTQSKKNLGDSILYREQNSSNQNSIAAITKNNNLQRSISYTQELSHSQLGLQGNFPGQSNINAKNNDENVQPCSQQILQTPLKLSYQNVSQQNKQETNLQFFNNKQQSGMINVQKQLIASQNSGQNHPLRLSHHQIESDNLLSSGINLQQQKQNNHNFYSRINHNNQKVGSQQQTIGGLQQIMNNTANSNFTDQLVTSVPNADRYNQIRNSLGWQTQVQTKNSINMGQNNFNLTSAKAIRDLLDIQSPSSQTNQIINVNQILSNKNQTYNNQFNHAIQNNILLLGSDLVNKQRNQSLSQSKLQIINPFEKVQLNLNKNLIQNSLGQFQELINVQDTFTFQGHKNCPQKVQEVDEDQYSQNYNQHSFENLKNVQIPQNNFDEDNDQEGNDKYTSSMRGNQRPKSKSTFTAASNNQQQFSRLNTFSQNENEIQDDIMSANNINDTSNQIQQQNQSSNKKTPVNNDFYSSMIDQQNQLIQSKQQQQLQSNFQSQTIKQQQPLQMIQISTPIKASYVSQTQSQLSAKQQSSQNLLSVRKVIEETSDLSIRRQKQQVLSGSSQNLVDKHIDDIDSDIYNLSTKYYNRNLLNKVFKTLKRSIQSKLLSRREDENNQKSLMFYYRALKVKAFYSWKTYLTAKQNNKKAIKKINYVKELHHSSGKKQEYQQQE